MSVPFKVDLKGKTAVVTGGGGILCSCMAETLPRYCIPERFIHMKALPLTERGKMDYKALVLTDPERNNTIHEAPVTEKEQQ